MGVAVEIGAEWEIGDGPIMFGFAHDFGKRQNFQLPPIGCVTGAELPATIIDECRITCTMTLLRPLMVSLLKHEDCT